MQIGELATKTGFSRDTIRYYEQRGLFAETDIHYRANGYKNYGPRAVERLDWIDTLKQHGFTLSEIRALVPRLEHAVDCDGMPAILVDKLAELEAQIRELERFRNRVRAALDHCGGGECEGEADGPASPGER